MAFLTFDKTYSVGIPFVDDQHAGLFDALSELRAAILKGQPHAVIGRLLQDLLAYTRSYFGAEEAMLAKAEYPGLGEHQKKHKLLTAQMAECVEGYKRSDAALSLHVINFLRDWLTSHILREDRAFGAWLSQPAPRP